MKAVGRAQIPLQIDLSECVFSHLFSRSYYFNLKNLCKYACGFYMVYAFTLETFSYLVARCLKQVLSGNNFGFISFFYICLWMLHIEQPVGNIKELLWMSWKLIFLVPFSLVFSSVPPKASRDKHAVSFSCQIRKKHQAFLPEPFQRMRTLALRAIKLTLVYIC